jgi:hypothetical protein
VRSIEDYHRRRLSLPTQVAAPFFAVADSAVIVSVAGSAVMGSLYVLAVILNAVKDPESLRPQQPSEFFNP